jgi:hypothetical protein
MNMMKLAAAAAFFCIASTAAGRPTISISTAKLTRIGDRICWPGWPRISPIPRTSRSALQSTAMFTPTPFPANSPAFIRSSVFIIPPIAPIRRFGASWMEARDELSALGFGNMRQTRFVGPDNTTVVSFTDSQHTAIIESIGAGNDLTVINEHNPNRIVTESEFNLSWKLTRGSYQVFRARPQ